MHLFHLGRTIYHAAVEGGGPLFLPLFQLLLLLLLLLLLMLAPSWLIAMVFAYWYHPGEKYEMHRCNTVLRNCIAAGKK